MGVACPLCRVKHDREPPGVFRIACGERTHIGEIDGATVDNAVVEICQNCDRCWRRRDAKWLVGGVVGGEQVADKLRPLTARGFGKDLCLALNAAGHGVGVADEQPREEATDGQALFVEHGRQQIRLDEPAQRQARPVQDDGVTAQAVNADEIAGVGRQVN